MIANNRMGTIMMRKLFVAGCDGHQSRTVITFAVVGLMSALCCSGIASAQVCNVDVSAMNFGTVTLSGSATADTTALLQASCTGLASQTIRLCSSATNSTLALPGGKVTKSGATQMLDFAFYSNPSRTVPWNKTIDIVLDGSGAGSMQLTLYGRLYGNGGATLPGQYLAGLDLGLSGDYSINVASCGGGVAFSAKAPAAVSSSKTAVTPLKAVTVKK